jgi:pyruvate/2-oxoglutarate dehydrogenase complex dihydrolipoamide dehydrogenase (E3) component
MTSQPSTLVLPDDEYNHQLIENVHPPGWTNPAPKGRYNLVVIGAGTAGLVASGVAAALGARVALIEKHLMGGDCTNYGCVPSKALIRSARAAHALQEASEFGVNLRAGGETDFCRVMERMRRLRARISANDSAERLAALGVAVYFGSARFLSRNTVEVAGRRLSFAKALIAAGGRPAVPAISGLEEAGYHTNETIFSLARLPRTLLVIGAGPIGCELAQTFRRYGSGVVMISRGARLLPRDESDAADILKRRFEREGIRMIFGAEILRAEGKEDNKQIVLDCGRGEERVPGDEILVAVGRHPNIEGLDLPAAGVEFDQKGVRVDDRLRTSNPDIYAAGDVCSAYKFTHAAEAMARVALQNALLFGRKRMSDLVIPWCTYTDPEIAHVGISAEEARKNASNLAVYTKEFADMDRAILDGETEGFVRIYANKKNGRLLGATMVGAHAGESIGEAVLALTQRATVAALRGVIHPYPTQAEAFKRAAEIELRSRLKPWMRNLLGKYFNFRR